MKGYEFVLRDEVAGDGVVRDGLWSALAELDRGGERRRVLAVPPDYTRVHSRSGALTEVAWEFYGGRLADVLPALGTHRAMTATEIAAMCRWCRMRWPGWRMGRRIFSLGRGVEAIDRSHFLVAVYGMERVMGRADTPVRRVLHYASANFGGALPQTVYVQTVLSKNAAGKLVMRGMYIGDDRECFELAAALSLQCNCVMMEREIHQAVVWLDPRTYKSTWLGNKSVPNADCGRFRGDSSRVPGR